MELKIRAWDNVNKRMGHFDSGFAWNDEYNLWHLQQVAQEHANQITDVPCAENIELTRQIGLNDKNVKEIYTGDVVVLYKEGEEYFRGVVTDHGHHGITVDSNNDYMEFELKGYSYEVIGNKFEHPHLLNQ